MYNEIYVCTSSVTMIREQLNLINEEVKSFRGQFKQQSKSTRVVTDEIMKVKTHFHDQMANIRKDFMDADLEITTKTEETKNGLSEALVKMD